MDLSFVGYRRMCLPFNFLYSVLIHGRIERIVVLPAALRQQRVGVLCNGRVCVCCHSLAFHFCRRWAHEDERTLAVRSVYAVGGSLAGATSVPILS